MNVVTACCFALLAIAAVICIARAIRARSLADRIIALDSLLVVLVGAVAALTARRGDDAFLDLAVVAALLGFLGTVTVARYIERRGA